MCQSRKGYNFCAFEAKSKQDFKVINFLIIGAGQKSTNAWRIVKLIIFSSELKLDCSLQVSAQNSPLSNSCGKFSFPVIVGYLPENPVPKLNLAQTSFAKITK